MQIVDTGLTQTQTKDGYNVLVQVYMLWRIEDPLKFFKTLKDESTARERLGNLLRGKLGQFGTVAFKQLVSTNAKELKFADVETMLLDAVHRDPNAITKLDPDTGAEIAIPKAQDKDAYTVEEYGIKIEHVGVRRLVLPEQVTPKVFERMTSDRQRIASRTSSTGASVAEARISEAKSIKKIILSFANKYAAEIETEGKSLAAEVYKEFARDEAFAIYLRQMETLEKIFSKTGGTFIFDAAKVGDVNPISLFPDGPASADIRPPLRPVE